jgi:hypothetical protein
LVSESMTDDTPTMATEAGWKTQSRFATVPSTLP